MTPLWSSSLQEEMSLLTEQKSQSEESIWHQTATQKHKNKKLIINFRKYRTEPFSSFLSTPQLMSKTSPATFAFSGNHEEKQLPGNAAGDLLPFHSRKCANIQPHSVVCWLLRSWQKPPHLQRPKHYKRLLSPRIPAVWPPAHRQANGH